MEVLIDPHAVFTKKAIYAIIYPILGESLDAKYTEAKIEKSSRK